MGASLFARTHDLAAPSVQSQIHELVRAGYPSQEARAIIAYHSYGIVPKGQSVGPLPQMGEVGTGLFSSQSVGECNRFSPGRLTETPTRLAAMHAAGGAWKDLADAFTQLPPKQSEIALNAAWKFVCE
ncbi:MAG: hypothetical protein ABI224_13985 [Acetobacteraceae bacterium]